MKIYVAIAKCGCYDEVIEKIIYVGTNITIATENLKKHDFDSDVNNFGWIEIWEKGKFLCTKEVIN